MENINNGILERISQGEHRTEVEGARRTEEIIVELNRRSEKDKRNAQKDSRELSEREQIDIFNAIAEQYAKENGIWIPLKDITKIGVPSESGYENEVFLDVEHGFVYKVNNLLYNEGSLQIFFDYLRLHNKFSPDTAYDIIAFTGFDKGIIYPVTKQKYVANAIGASPEQIAEHMNLLGFEKITDSKFSNGKIIVSDLLPRNVLINDKGSIYIIDNYVRQNEARNTAINGQAQQRSSESGSRITETAILTGADRQASRRDV